MQTSEAPLVTGNLWRAIWIMSWPLLLTTIANSMVSLTDVFVAGKLGSSTQAAVGLAEHVLFIFMISIMSIGVGTTALVSRAFGAANREEMLNAAGQSLTLSVLTGIVMTVLALLAANFVLPYFASSPEVAQSGRSYLAAYAFVLLPFSVSMIANSAFRAIGDSKTTLAIVVTATTLNILGDFATVIYNFPVAGLGIKGMAYAGLLGSTVGALLAFICLRRSPLKESLSKLLPIHKDILARVLRIGVPSALGRLGWSLSVFVVFFILIKCPDSTNALASWTIGMRVESLVFMPLMALSLSVASIVGQNLGAREIERAYSAGWRVTGIGVWMMTAAALILFFFAPSIARALTSESGAIDYTTHYLRINCLGEPFLALGMVLTGALQGAGDSKGPMWFTLICNWLIRIPVAWLLALTFKLGPDGVWWSMTLSIVIQGILMVMRYRARKWIQIKV